MKICNFRGFRAYLRVFKIFNEIYMLAMSYRVFAADIKILLISAIFGIFKLSVLTQAFDLEQ